MTQEVEMKEAQAAPSNSASSASLPSTLQRELSFRFLAVKVWFLFSFLDYNWEVFLLGFRLTSDLKDIASLIETGAYAKEVRRIVRAVRLTIMLRRKLKAATLSGFLNFALAPGSEAHSKLSSYLPKVWLVNIW